MDPIFFSNVLDKQERENNQCFLPHLILAVLSNIVLSVLPVERSMSSRRTSGTHRSHHINVPALLIELLDRELDL